MRIALAHNLNDQAETMLHHLARGTGIRGLAGIRAVSGNIIRPVLCLERKEIDHYLVEEGIFYIQDSTNLKDDYTRNRIRHHILPLLEQEVNVKTVVHMANAAQTLKRAEDYLVQQSRLLLENCVKEEGYLFGQAFLRPRIFCRSMQCWKRWKLLPVNAGTFRLCMCGRCGSSIRSRQEAELYFRIGLRQEENMRESF